MSSLGHWERTLEEASASVELLGEIDLNGEDAKQLGSLLAEQLERRGFQSAHALLTDRFPTCLAVYLVAQGIYGYRRGDYWSAIATELRTQVPLVRTHWGPFFESYIARRSLPAFPNVRGLRYVKLILLHGGIPDYCLGRFFEQFLWPALTHPQSAGHDAEELITTRISRRSSEYGVRPLMRFVRYGGKVAVDFVARSLEMARRYFEEGVPPDKHNAGLPGRIVQRFRDWSQHKGALPTHAGSGRRLRAPVLYVDPPGGDVRIELPAEPLGRESSGGQWLIDSGGRRRARALPAGSSADGLRSQADDLALPPPSLAYEVTFADGQGMHRRWSFSGYADSAGRLLLAFGADTGQLCTSPAGVPAKEVWLLHSSPLAVQAPGGTFKERLPLKTAEWRDYTLERWDLRRASTLQLGAQPVPLLPDENSLLPQLTGGRLLAAGQGPGGCRVYVKEPPQLRVPLTPQRDADSELQRWQLTLRTSRGFALGSWRLVELQHALHRAADAVTLPLAELEPLGGALCGTFELVLHGPLGRDLRLQFGFIKELGLHGHQQLRLPTAAGRVLPAEVALTTDRRLQLDCPDGSAAVATLRPGHYQLQVAAESELAMIALRLRHGSRHELPLQIAVPVVRWCWLAEGATGPAGQCAPPREESADWLEHATDPWLVVWIEPRLPLMEGLSREGRLDLGAGERPALTAQLVVPYATAEPAQQLAPRRTSGARLYFNLREAADSVARRDRERIVVELVLQHAWLPASPSRLPVLVLQSDQAPGELQVEGCLVDATWMIELAWTAPRRLVDQKLRLWSLGRPWEPPHQYAIPDDAAASCTLQIALARLPPGAYRAELAVVDPWSTLLPQRPGRRAPGKVDLVLGEPRERRRHLEALPADARGALERALMAETALELNQVQTALVRYSVHSTASDYLAALWLLIDGYGEQDAPATRLGLIQLFGRLLRLLPPVALLVETARLAAPMTALERANWADWVQSVSAPVAYLLRLMQRDGGLYSDDLEHALQLDLLPAPARDAALAQLTAAGIQLRSPPEAGLDEDLVLVTEPKLEAVRSARHREASENLPELLQIYLRQIGRIPLLTPGQERQLASLIQEGLAADARLHNPKKRVDEALVDSLAERVTAGQHALQSLATANLRFVVNKANKFVHRGLAPEDLIQEGSIGVLKAAGKFDGRRGVRFFTYASWWIVHMIRRAIDDQARVIRLPVHRIVMLQRLRQARREFWREMHREPSTAELAEALGRTEKVINALMLMNNQAPVSFDAEIEGFEGITLAELLPDPQTPDSETEQAAEELKTQLHKFLAELEPRSREIVSLRYGLNTGKPHTLEEISQFYGCSRERIRQIIDKALVRLRHPKRAARLGEFR